MPNILITQFNTGSIADSSLIIIGDPNSGALSRTSYRALRDYMIVGISGSQTPTGSLTPTASFNAFTSSISTQVTNSFASQSNYLQTSSFSIFSASVFSQFANITSSGGPSGSFVTTSSFQTYTSSINVLIANVFASQSNYETIVSHNAYTASVLNQFGQYLQTSSFSSFSSSVATQFANVTGSGGSTNTGSLLLTSSFNIYTSSVASQSLNIFASQSNYESTASFNTFSSSLATQVGNIFSSQSNYVLISSLPSLTSLNTFTGSISASVLSVYASQSNYLLTGSFNTFSSSVATQFSNITASGTGDNIQVYNGTGSSFSVSNSINVLYMDPVASITGFTLLLPATASSTNNFDVFFGGNVPNGTVINGITFVTGSSGQKIIQNTSASVVSAGEAVSFKYRSATSTWYRKF